MTSRRFMPTILALAVLAIAPVAAQASTQQYVSGFHDDLEAVIAPQDDTLWLGVTGTERGSDKVFSRVVRFRDGRWSKLGPALPADSGHAIHLVALESGPCFADNRRSGQPRIRCHVGGKWRARPIPRALRGYSLQGLKPDGTGLLAVFSKTASRAGTGAIRIAFASIRAGGSRVTGPKLGYPKPAFPDFTRATTGQALGRFDLSVMDINANERWSLTRGPGGWRRSPSLSAKKLVGPVGSSIIESDAGLIAPLMTEVSTTGYGGRTHSSMLLSIRRLTARGWSPVGIGSLNTTYEQAQGGVYPVGDRVWAVWQENGTEGIAFGGMLRTAYHAARLSSDGTGFDLRVELWRGRTMFPSPLQAVSFQGGPVFLYQRQSGPRSGLRTVVDFSRQSLP